MFKRTHVPYIHKLKHTSVKTAVCVYTDTIQRVCEVPQRCFQKLFFSLASFFAFWRDTLVNEFVDEDPPGGKQRVPFGPSPVHDAFAYGLRRAAVPRWCAGAFDRVLCTLFVPRERVLRFLATGRFEYFTDETVSTAVCVYAFTYADCATEKAHTRPVHSVKAAPDGDVRNSFGTLSNSPDPCIGALV